MSESPGEPDPKTAVTVGRVLAPHGLRGEVKVESLTDFPERFAPGNRLWLRGHPATVEASRWQGRTLLLKLDGVDDRETAEGLRGADLQAPAPTALEEGRYYQHEIIGLTVRDSHGAELGRVEEIISTGSNDVYVVRGRRGELLLPAIEDVVVAVDLARGQIVVELMEGLDFTPVKRAPGSSRPRTSRRAGGGGSGGQGATPV